MYIFAGIMTVAAFLIILAPLFIGQGGALASASSLNSPERLVATKNAILKRYIEDEKSFDDKKINKLIWEQRKQYLSNRYIDAARRLDYINDLLSTQKKMKEGKTDA